MGQSKNQHKYREGGLNAIPYAVAVFGVAFLASCLTASIMTPVTNSDATSGADINVDVDSVAYYVTIGGGSTTTISKDVNATTAGSIGVVTDNVTVSSNTPNGYYIYLSMLNATHGQYLYNTTEGLESNHISPIDTTEYSLSTPGNLSAANTWGVATSDTYNAAFDAAASYASDSVITQATKFAPVPAYQHEELLIDYSGHDTRNGGAGSSQTFPVYYGYHVNSALPSGTYSNTVMYTAYADSVTGSDVASYTGDGITYKTGGTVTFATSLYTDRALAASDATVTINGETCTVTDVSQKVRGTNDTVIVTCTAPTQSKPGVYPVVIELDGYGYRATTELEYGTDGVTVAGTTYTKMQSLPNEWCANWATTPNAFTTGSGPIYNYGVNTNSIDAITNPSTTYTDAGAIAAPTSDDYWNRRRTVRISNINDDVPEAYLKDDRDGNYYRVRKLADGNCWMTENLRLVFSSDDNLEIGKVASDGKTITGTGKYITTDNTQVTSAQLENWAGINSKTEVSGTLGSAHTVWGAGTDQVSDGKHPTATGSVTNNADASIRAATYARSYYNATTSSACANGLNDVTTTSSSNCFIGDNDEQTIGTYYNFTAATAGKGTKDMTTGSSTTDSICPKGWQLPTNTGTKSYYNLLVDVYGGGTWDASTNTDGVRWNRDSRSNQSSADGGDYHLWAMTAATRLAPLSLPFSGLYRYYSGAVYDVGSGGVWWSSTATSASTARYLARLSGRFYPQGDNYKGYGFTVRCVAQ